MSIEDLDHINYAELDQRLTDDRMKTRMHGPVKQEGKCNAEVGEEVYCWQDPDEGTTRCNLHGGGSLDENGDPKSVKHGSQKGHDRLKEGHDNSVEHWLKTSARTFYESAPDHYQDLYTVFLESLSQQYEEAHGNRPKIHELGQLEAVAFNMVKLRMSRQYEVEQAVDESLPLTETKVEDIGGEPMEVEVISKVNTMKKDIRRENRLALKDMGIGPEQTAEEDEDDEEEVINWAEDLEQGSE